MYSDIIKTHLKHNQKSKEECACSYIDLSKLDFFFRQAILTFYRLQKNVSYTLYGILRFEHVFWDANFF